MMPEPESFYISRLKPILYGEFTEAPEGRCGLIQYQPEGIADYPEMLSWDMAQINPATVSPTDLGLEFLVYNDKWAEVGDYPFKIHISST